MRSSLSCDACRRAKVKCAHDGEPPCSRCAKSKVPGCTLLRPRVDLEKANRVRAKRKEEKRAALAAASQATSAPETSPGMPTPRSSHRTSLRTPQEEHEEDDGQDTEGAKLDLLRVDRHIGTLPNSTILKSLNTFSNKFPELAILHLPTFMQEFESPSCSRESMALLAAVLAVTRAQLASQGAAWTEGLLSREEYATYAKERLQEFMLKEPRVQAVQALLIITLHEWGTRDFHKAWVYCGIAIRIMQALHSQRVSPYPLDPSSERGRPARNAVTAAIETRAYWACFLMDCMVNSGTYNPPMLPMSEMHKLKIPRPLSAVEFAFGPELPSHAMPLAGGGAALDITQSFEILVGGFEIWAKVMEFIFNDGRKAPGMCAPHNCPWVPGSPWMSSWSRLRSWRADQHRNLHYPSTSVAVHMTLGYGETFTYLNLLYYVSNLMLHREYTPFLPTPESVPQGPVDKPLLEATAPNGWWEDNAAEIFGSAENIALLLHEASECGVPLMTPFAGFCAFSACYVLVYVYRFPRMNLGRSPRAEECMHMCMDYLHQFRNVWKIADGWIKTLQYASLLYGRAATEGRYRGRTRADFDNLHQSVHEFRVVDRSEQHLQEIDGADRPVEQPDSSRRHLYQHQQPHHATQHEPDRFAGSFGFDDQTMDTNMLLNQLMAEVSTNVDEQGAWSQWWPTMQEVELPEGVPLLM